MKNSHIGTIKYTLYCICLFFIALYPGKNIYLELYARNPQAFEKTQQPIFTPAPFPFVEKTVLPPEISAQSYLVLDLHSFTPIASKAPDERRLPASTVKLATAIVAYDYYGINKTLTVKKVINEELKMNLIRGEQISALNLLYGTLVHSANDAAYTLAENYPGGVAAFIRAMNALARQLNMENTQFKNPIGFDHPKQYTTAYDMALLARHFAQIPLMLNITSTKSITVANADFTRFHYLSSSNQLLGEIPHLGGLKTGYTDTAGQNLISYYIYQNKPLVIIVLNSQDRFADTKLLIDFINANVRYEELPLTASNNSPS